ncbi:amphi-Trp domain-containing protein [Streptomyces sp. NPDC093795]|uniref:amphi-Trp domain-containing protein n=1 Tax=Streptomyces sp. NPDC093795 TaxID=3366051 RepID=UPI003816A4F1
MKDLEFEQKRSVSRLEAAEQLMALATALKDGGQIEWDVGHGKLSLRVPDELHSGIEVEMGEGKIELEIELEWPTTRLRSTPSKNPTEKDDKAGQRENTPPPDRKPKRTAAGTRKTTPTKRPTSRT